MKYLVADLTGVSDRIPTDYSLASNSINMTGENVVGV